MEKDFNRRKVEREVNKKSYHKPIIIGVGNTKIVQSIQLAGVRAIPIMILKSKLINK